MADDKEDKHSSSVWQDVAGIGKHLLPYIAVATAGAAVFGVASMISNKRAEKPKIDEALDPYRFLVHNLGDSAPIQLLIRYSCISPDWHKSYFESAERLIICYNDFHHLAEACELNMNACEEQVENPKCGASQLVEKIADWRVTAYTSKYFAAKLFESMLEERQVLLTLSAQFLQLVRAFNVYWRAVKNTFLANVVIKSKDDYQANEMMALKVRYAKVLRQSGLDSILRVGEYAGQSGNTSLSANQLDLGSVNSLVTRHLSLWVRMHTTFLPQQAQVAQLLGWSQDDDWHDEPQVIHVNNQSHSKPNNRKKKSQVKEEQNMANPKSSLIAQVQVWRGRLKKDGIVDVVTNPFKGFQPSPWQETFIPTESLDQKAVQTAFQDLSCKYDSNIEFANKCIEMVNKTYTRTMLATGKMAVRAHWDLNDLDAPFEEYIAVASESNARCRVLQTMWTAMGK